MVVYVWQQYIQIQWLFVEDDLKKEIKKNWIEWLLPVFANVEDAKNFCWNKYITMWQL